MDSCMVNLDFVQHIAGLNPLDTKVDPAARARCKAGPQISPSDEQLVCPKPCRITPSCFAPEFMKPFFLWESSSGMLECETSYEVLEIFLKKGVMSRDGGEISSFGRSPSYCSPPCRSSNPVVHDAHFCNQRSCSSVVVMRPKPIPVPSLIACPAVRVEGFECPCSDAM
ncbi:hypothetical protein KP509_27G068200 [Ceratopteris richardii]|uniref:Uncharacterized protein n=1 Tax=Ceratopteris richardii TaxID=49495 RepID=A0A8T2RJ31_CERRI|nr:hypothetical protein KP509_27G068200 [Ceratopteris richardii]KAH7295845.1 hypothetical protein KP509_27G068200 [Ceratopteris richardii]